MSVTIGTKVSDAAFLSANAFFLTLMVALVLFLIWKPTRFVLVVMLGTVVVINAVLHISGTVVGGEYSPGLASGTVLWLPLGTMAIVEGRHILSQGTFLKGVFLGIVAHMLVPLVGIIFIFNLGAT
jgi:hypothetical protein